MIKPQCKCKPRILLVDDNKFNLMPIISMLSTMKFDLELIQRIMREDFCHGSASSFKSCHEEIIVNEQDIESLSDQQLISPRHHISNGAQDIFSLESVYDGFQAVQQFHSSISSPSCTCSMCYFSLIIMDYNMPEMNGLDATKAILQLQQEITAGDHQECNIVGLTANTSFQMKKECLEAG